MTDAALKATAMEILVKELGVVATEKFISLILKEPFDYTEWRKDLFEDMSIEELNDRAMGHWNAKYIN